jgi:hypothetical protein
MCDDVIRVSNLTSISSHLLSTIEIGLTRTGIEYVEMIRDMSDRTESMIIWRQSRKTQYPKGLAYIRKSYGFLFFPPALLWNDERWSIVRGILTIMDEIRDHITTMTSSPEIYPT